MTWATHPVTPDCFEDFADVINRTRRANHCWCLSHRLGSGEIEELGGGAVSGPYDACERGAGSGLRVVGTTDAVAGGLPRLVMRRELL